MNIFRSRKFNAASLGMIALTLSNLTLAEAQTVASDSDSDKEAPTVLSKYTVIGSNIPTTLASAGSGTFPVVSLDRSGIDRSGLQNTAQLLQTLTISNQGAIPISNNGTGFTPSASAVSIHALGPEATLVLINGHRVASFPVGQNGTTAFVDLNVIPLSAVERVDVLKDGASAEYGADAVAGVVNIVLRKGYDGSEAFAAYQNTTDKDSSQFTANLLSGASSKEASIMVGFNFQSRAAIFNRDRSYSAVPAFLSSNSSPINAEITGSAYAEALGLPPGSLPSAVTPPDEGSEAVFFATPGPLSKTGMPVPSTNNGTTPPSQYNYSDGRAAKYNYNQDAGAYPSSERYGTIFSGERKIFGTDNVKAYFDGGYQTSTTENQLAPTATGDFTVPGQTELIIPARTANPLPTADGRDRAAPAGAYNPFNPFNMDIAGGTRFRLKEFGNRVLKDTTDSFLGTVGIKAENIANKFDLDAGFRYSEVVFKQNDKMVSASKFNRILNAADPIFNPTSGQYIGTSTPYNPFGYYVNPIPNNSALVNFATVYTHDVNTSRLGNGYITAATQNLFTVPAGDVDAAVGLDYRVETLAQSPDDLNRTGDIIGASPAAITDHRRKVIGFYGELQAPLVAPAQNIPGVHDLSMNVAGRYENFLTNKETTTVPKIGIRYQPVDDNFTLRASASKGFLEPSLYQLYAGSVASLVALTDPRTDDTIPEVSNTLAGNSKLKPETTKSYNLGIVWSPKYWHLHGLTVSLDLWRVDRDGTASYDLQNVVDRFFKTAPGGLQPGESVLLNPDGSIQQVNTTYINAGKTVAYGTDMGINYTIKTQSFGRFDIGAAATYLGSFKQALTPGAPLTENVDQTTDGQGQDAFLRWKGTTEFNWRLNAYQASVTGHYINGFHDFDLDGNDRRVASTMTWDVQLSYKLEDELGGYLKGSTIAVGAYNVLDKAPPLSQYGGANPNNYPGYIYTAEGRMWYVSLDSKF